MNTSIRSFFTTVTLVAAALLTGCAGTGGLQGQARLPVSIGGNMGSITIGGQGSNGGGTVYAPQNQPQAQQQQCPQGTQLWNMSDGSRQCLPLGTVARAPLQQVQPNWCGDSCRPPGVVTTCNTHTHYIYGSQCLRRPIILRPMALEMDIYPVSLVQDEEV